jgi:hypothetical protein
MEPLWSYDLITIIQCLDETRDRIRKEIAANRATPQRLKQLEAIEPALAELKIAYNECRNEDASLMPFDELFRFE